MTEPAITVNPANPRNIVATWKQDSGPVSARTDLVASSLDGGKTWARRTIPGLTVCTGGTADVASDPWISAAGDGSVYFSAVLGDLSSLAVRGRGQPFAGWRADLAGAGDGRAAAGGQ